VVRMVCDFFSDEVSMVQVLRAMSEREIHGQLPGSNSNFHSYL
jgi:hypothetical protein